MSLEEIQYKLDRTYQKYYNINKLKKLNKPELLSAPFILKIYEEYLNSPVKIMFVGKEVNSWQSKLDKIIKKEDFLEILKNRYQKEFDTEEGWNTAFFRTYKNIREQLTNNKKGTIVWNNLLKFSYDNKGTYSKNAICHSEELEKISIEVFKEEVTVLKPDFMIFATSTGQGYDSIIKKCFNKIDTDKSLYEKNNMWKFITTMYDKNNSEIKCICYRTRHPNATKFNGKCNTVNEYYQMIIEDIKQQL